MKYFKMLVLIIIVVGVLPACDDDDPIMDLVFPQPGYLWIVLNYHLMPSEGGSAIHRWSYNESYEHQHYNTPFSSSNAYDAACGDGKVWVTGWAIYGDEGQFEIWEAISDEQTKLFRSSPGLTYDGESLWSGSTDSSEGNEITRFYRMDPTSYDVTDVFPFSNPPEKRLKGLAWSDMGLWSVFSRPTPPPEQPEIINEFILFDPETGEDIYHIDCSVEYPVGLAWDGEGLWTNDRYSGRTYRIDPKNGKVLGYFDLFNTNNYPYGLCFEATAAR